MDFTVHYLSFFVISEEQGSPSSGKTYKHYQTMDGDEYETSSLKTFLDGEFSRIAKRKVERNPRTGQVPTKIGRFIVEPGFDLESNPNYNMLARLRAAETKEQFLNLSDELIQAYLSTSAARGGAFIVATTKLSQYFDEPFVFVMKCDFEQKIARITDEKSLIHQVEMAINAKNMKSIQYPYMPEPGMLEPWELKIHQSSHARYFEDFLKFVEYEKTMPEVIQHQVLGLVQQHIENTWEPESEERQKEEQDIELWAASEKRELQEKWTPAQVMEAAEYMVEQKPDLEMRFRIGGISVKALLADYGYKVHFARLGDRYVVLLSGDYVQFDKEVSPIELLQPEELHDVIERISRE